MEMTPQSPEPAATKRKRSGLGSFIVLGGVLAVIILILVVGLLTGGEARVEAGMAPDFTLKDFNGQSWQLSDLKGQVVVVNFWATWCVSCKDEAADLEQVWRDYQDQGVQFLGVDYLDQEPLNFEYIDRYDITYPNGHDVQGRIYNAYGVQGLPETFIVDQNGEIVQVYIGAVTRQRLAADLDKLLGAQSAVE